MNKIKHWITADWPAPANIHALTTLRTGGVSQDTFFSLNPANHVNDDNDRVNKNRQIISDMLQLPSEPVWLDQIHGNQAVEAIETGVLKSADASYTAKSGVVCAIMTADCLPLLICSSDGLHVAAIHAGWRGLLTGVIANTIMALEISYNVSSSRGDFRDNFDFRDNLLVWLGPAIGPNRFEVGSEVRDAYLVKSVEFASAFKEQASDKWLADIYKLARIELAFLGVNNVYGGTHCTFTEQEQFYSYRRDKQTGRMATLIWRE
jgi:YfiH family protein